MTITVILAPHINKNLPTVESALQDLQLYIKYNWFICKTVKAPTVVGVFSSHLVLPAGADPHVAPEPGASRGGQRRTVPPDHMTEPEQQRQAEAERPQPAESLRAPEKTGTKREGCTSCNI